MSTDYLLVNSKIHQRIREQELVEQIEKENRAKKNYNFVQVEKKSLRAIREMYEQNPNAGKLLFILAEKMNRQNAIVCSYETLSKITNLGRTTLYKAIKYLREHNWIQVVKIGSANAYIINSKVFWQSSGDQKMTVFHATIIASSSEQDTSIENWDNLILRHVPLLERTDETIVTNETLPQPDQDEMDFHQ